MQPKQREEIAEAAEAAVSSDLGIHPRMLWRQWMQPKQLEEMVFRLFETFPNECQEAMYPPVAHHECVRYVPFISAEGRKRSQNLKI